MFGGLFCLRRYAVGLIVDQQSGQCKGIIDSTGTSCIGVDLS